MSSSHIGPALAALYPSANPHIDYRVVASETGTISIDPASWNVEKLGPLDVDAVAKIAAKAFECAKDDAVTNVRRRAAQIRRQIAETDDPIQIAAWANKATIARRFAAGTASEAEVTSLITEAEMRGKNETPQQLAGRILIWSELDAAAAAMADAAQKQAEMAILAAGDEAALALALARIDAQVTQLASQRPLPPADMMAASEARFKAEPKIGMDVTQIKTTLSALEKAVA